MKKLAFIIPDLYSRGMPRVLESLENEISENEYDKYIILLKKKPIKFHVKGKIIEVEKEGNSFLSKIYIFIKRLIKIYSINKKYKFDYIISFGMTSNIISIVTSKYGKVIITEHNVKSIENSMGKSIKGSIYNKIYDFFIRRLYNKADVIVGVSKYIGLDLIKNYGVEEKKIYTIYNGVNEKIINELKYEELSKEEEQIFKNPVIINVGALSFQKGQWHLIKIIPELKKEIPNIQLVILGDGEYKGCLLKLIKQLKINDCVHLLGVKNNPYKYMYRAKIFVLSSLYEGFPNVLVEAMTVGVPIISVDCKSGPRELMSSTNNIEKKLKGKELSKYGILIAPFNILEKDENKNITNEEKNLIEAIVLLLKNKKLYSKYKKNINIRAIEFTSEKMKNEYERLFEK